MSMKRAFLLCLVGVLFATSLFGVVINTEEENWTYGAMHQWRAHSSYSSIQELAVASSCVYALSNNSLFSVDKQSEEMSYYSRLTGLSGSVIHHIAHNAKLDVLLICYQNGQIDVIDNRDDIYNISDLYLKQISASKEVNHIYMHQNNAYLAMDFGIISLDLHKKEIANTYYIGEGSTEVAVKAITVMGDSIYAASSTTLYSAHLRDNLLDYAYWHRQSLPPGGVVQDMCTYGNRICLLMDHNLWSCLNGVWVQHEFSYPLRKLFVADDQLFATLSDEYGVAEIHSDMSVTLVKFPYNYHVHAIAKDGQAYWLGTQSDGLVRLADGVQVFQPDGPSNPIAYRMRFYGDRLYIVPGGRWAVQNKQQGEIMYYENNTWTNISTGELTQMANHALYDFMNVAQDPHDPEHYFVTTYGTGLLEMRENRVVNLYLPHNSPLKSAAPNDPDFYTRTDGAMYDEKGNLWLINTHDDANNIHVIEPNGNWHSYNVYDGSRVVLYTPGEIMMDRRQSAWKWIPLCRYNTGLLLLNDNGTPTDPSDDQCTFRSQWMDQYGKLIKPEYIYTIAQDHDNTIWVGTSAGLFTIPSSIDFTSSDQCRRVVIARNDGTSLGDYLLENEQINCIVIDGANRKWIGTANSGLFLIEIKDNEQGGTDVNTVIHFTTDNSLLPSNTVLSIAIQQSTGEVFIGTSDGLVSYMSDAVEPEADFSQLYAYPNPVLPTYKGSVVIKGLMADTEVRIVDANGNLIKRIEGSGGEVVWDMTNAVGERVASGVYTAICNTMDGSQTGHVKVMVFN